MDKNLEELQVNNLKVQRALSSHKVTHQQRVWGDKMIFHIWCPVDLSNRLNNAQACETKVFTLCVCKQEIYVCVNRRSCRV